MVARLFLSTPSARRATTQKPSISTPFTLFLSTPSARRATRRTRRHYLRSVISIHALREEGDVSVLGKHLHTRNFYPRPPRGGRPLRLGGRQRRQQFLSTPSARRATHAAPIYAAPPGNFYPRPPRGGRHCCNRKRYCSLVFLSTPSARRATREVAKAVYDDGISIHALREEGDEYHDSG